MIDSKTLLTEIDERRQSGDLKRAIADGQTRYQGSITNPGYLEKVDSDGGVTIGRFQNGCFKPKKDA